MNILESRRVRHLLIRLERGEELPGALRRALDEAEARAGWIEGIGSLEAAEIALLDQSAHTHAKTRRLDGPCEVVALSGTIAIREGESSLRLTATLAREADIGLQMSAGGLVWARVHSLDLRITVMDDISLMRPEEPRTAAAHTNVPPGTPPIAANGEPARIAPAVTTATEPPPLPMPQRPVSPRHEEEHYPEAGDTVTHFHFGECEVISSDGERIRLRQDRDGRVREVSLTMLRIEAPTVDAATSRRHFHLARKN